MVDPKVCIGLTALLAACVDDGTVVIQDKGSDTMVALMLGMSEEYSKDEPMVVVAVNGGGSGTGIKSIIDGTADVANASRKMKGKEIDAAKARGVSPHETIIAYDGLAVYVHSSNPLPQLTFEQLKCIYDETGPCDRWSDLGVDMKAVCSGDDTILKIGRQNNSGTYEYFKEEILGKTGKFTNTMDQSGTQQVVDVIATSPCAIGYGGMGYHNDTVRFVCLAREATDACAEPTIETVKAGNYKFARPLYLYTNGEPKGAIKNFIDWALGPRGQAVVLDAGFVPVAKE